MVKLHIKKGDDSQFLCETNVGVLVDELLTNIVAVYNGRLKVQRICAGLLLIFRVIREQCVVRACQCQCYYTMCEVHMLKTFTKFYLTFRQVTFNVVA